MFVLLWLMRLMTSLARSIYKARLPSAKQDPAVNLNEKKYVKNPKLASRARGGKSHATPVNSARIDPAKAEKPAPWGWPGNEYEIREHRPQVAMTKSATPNPYPPRDKLKRKRIRAWKENAGNLLRNSRSGLSGQSYQPSQDARSTFAIDKSSD